MILADSSIWIDHLRSPEQTLVSLLEAEQIVVHPWVTGELACGNLADRENTLELLRSVPQARVVDEDEVLFFIDRHRIAGKGVGYIDMHLLASAALGTLKIWTRDRRLGEVAALLGLNAVVTR